jgi:crotonobetaine/carnitine-CoA ligase
VAGVLSALDEELARIPTATALLRRGVSCGDPDRTLIHFEGSRWSYREVLDAVERRARGLRAAGVGRSDRVILLLANTPEAMIYHLAIQMAGGVYVPLLPESTEDELTYFLGHCEPSAVITDAERVPRLRRALRETPPALAIVLDDQPQPGIDGPQEILSDEQLVALGVRSGIAVVADINESADPVTVMYTSGSTGRPKGVILTHSCYVASGALWAHRLELGPQDTFLGVNPQHHAGGMKNIATALFCGGGYMMQRRFSVSRFWSDVAFSGATAGVLMPAMMAMLLTREPGADDRNHTLSKVVSHHINDEFEQRHGIHLITVWAMSELSAAVCLTAPDYPDRKPGLAGWVLHPDIDLRIVDERGADLAVGEQGEILCRSPWAFPGYLNDPDTTAATIRGEWVHSGDLGYLDESDRLFYVGRRKNMIKRAGENISALEVEQTLLDHPDVMESSCFGVPDAIRTEEIKAVLRMRRGSATDEAAVVAWAAERLSAFKVPRYVEFREELPRVAIHKVDLNALRREHVSSRGWDREEHKTGAPQRRGADQTTPAREGTV